MWDTVTQNEYLLKSCLVLRISNFKLLSLALLLNSFNTCVLQVYYMYYVIFHKFLMYPPKPSIY